MSARKFASLAYSNISPAQLSNVQSVLDAKASLANATFTGDVAMANLLQTGTTTSIGASVSVHDPVVTLNSDMLDLPTGLSMHQPSGPPVDILHDAGVVHVTRGSELSAVRAHTIHASPRVEPLQNSRTLVSSSNGFVTESSVSAANLVHVANVTSDVQSQLEILKNKSRKSYVVLGADVLVGTEVANIVQFTPMPFSTYVFTARAFLDSTASVSVSWLLPANTAQFAWAAHGNTAMLVANTAYSQTNASQVNVGGVIRTANCSGSVVLRANASTECTLLAPSYLTYTKISVT